MEDIERLVVRHKFKTEEMAKRATPPPGTVDGKLVVVHSGIRQIGSEWECTAEYNFLM